MKKLLLSLLIVPLFSQAQRSMQHYYSMSQITSPYKNSFYEEPFATEKLRKKLNISEVQIIYTDKRGREMKSLRNYNALGKTTFSQGNKWSVNYTYENDSLEINRVQKYKKTVYETKSAYANGKVTSVNQYKNGKLTSATSIQYNAQQQATESSMKIGRKTYVIQHTYGADNKLSKTVYLVKGKIKKEWIYECKPEGEIVASKTEALSSFCTYHSESADGSYSTFTRSLREGKPYLYKQTFNKDSILQSSQTYLKDSVLIWESHKAGNTETINGYKESGRLRYKQITVSDAAGNILSREYFQGKTSRNSHKNTFELNTDGTTKTQRRFHKGKLDKTTTYSYKFR